MYQLPAFRAGILCGGTREEEDTAAEVQTRREEDAGLNSNFYCVRYAKCSLTA